MRRHDPFALSSGRFPCTFTKVARREAGGFPCTPFGSGGDVVAGHVETACEVPGTARVLTRPSGCFGLRDLVLPKLVGEVQHHGTAARRRPAVEEGKIVLGKMQRAGPFRFGSRPSIVALAEHDDGKPIRSIPRRQDQRGRCLLAWSQLHRLGIGNPCQFAGPVIRRNPNDLRPCARTGRTNTHRHPNTTNPYVQWLHVISRLSFPP